MLTHDFLYHSVYFLYSVFTKYIPLVDANDVNVVSDNASVQQIVTSLKRTLTSDGNIIPDSERNNLLNLLTLPNTSVEDFVSVLLQQPTVSTNLKAAVLSSSSIGASSRCVRSKDSYLFGSKYSELKEFNFTDVFTEMSTYQPFLLDHLLSVAVSTGKIFSNEDFFLRLVPKLSLIYSILMSTRFPELSRLQKVVSSTLIDEHVHQKVTCLKEFRRKFVF